MTKAATTWLLWTVIDNDNDSDTDASFMWYRRTSLDDFDKPINYSDSNSCLWLIIFLEKQYYTIAYIVEETLLL